MIHYLRYFSAALLSCTLLACIPAPEVDGGVDDTPDTPDEVNVDCSEQGNIVGNNLDDAAKQYVLCMHNEYRSEVALGNVLDYNSSALPMAEDMQALSWDENLEAVAQAHADKCVYEHNSERTADYLDIAGSTSINYVGENIGYYASSGNPMTMTRVTSIVEDFESEAEYYGYGAYNTSDVCNDVCGHATQMFWANTQYVGCAIASCPAGTLYPTLDAVFLVCNYGQGGNYSGQYPYAEAAIADDVCSDDRSGEQTECSSGLTHSSNYQNGL
jgi:hypothetical protein